MAHAYPTIAEAKSALHKMGDKISQQGTPKDFGPLVYAFTGSGNVSQVSHNRYYWLYICIFISM
jgi:alpha-aminoadipic semialdehyde synthase